jgi:trehalose/maltose hydrolase-like predicted phosphorylase
MQRTSHGSTLSRVVHSWVLARSDREGAWKLFVEALHSDIEDIQGGTTPEGIHLGAMAGTVDLIQRMHTGLEMRDDALWFNPYLPDELSNISVRIRYRGHWLFVHLDHDCLRVSFDRGGAPPIRIGFSDQIYEMCQGETQEFKLT